MDMHVDYYQAHDLFNPSLDFLKRNNFVIGQLDIATPLNFISSMCTAVTDIVAVKYHTLHCSTGIRTSYEY